LALSVIIKEEKFDFINATGFVIAYIGVILIVTRMDLSVIMSSDYNLGDILLLIGTLCFGLYNVLIRRYKFSFDSQNMKLLYIFMYGNFALLVWLLFDWQVNDLKWSFSFKDMISILILSLGASVLAYVFFNDGIKKIGASKASSFINLVPIITIVLSLVVLGERPSFSQIVGSVVILFGVFLSQDGISNLLTRRRTRAK
jgi:drug/metabolite transporter (DMT)-like permease